MQDDIHKKLLRAHQPEAGPSQQSSADGYRLHEPQIRLSALSHGGGHPDYRSGSPTVILPFCAVGERCRGAVPVWKLGRERWKPYHSDRHPSDQGASSATINENHG
jgi:hypothetical protein